MNSLQSSCFCSCMSITRAHEKLLQQLTVQRNKRHHQQGMHKRWAHQQHAIPLGIWCPGAAAVTSRQAAAAGSQAVVTCVTVAFMWALQMQFWAAPAIAAELGSSLQAEGNVPSELSAAGEQQAFPLSSLMQGSDKKQIEGCTRRCVPTCIRGGEGSPGLGPISMRREIVVFKDGFRSRQYCLLECAQTCKLISDTEKQQQQQQQKRPQ